MLTTPDDSGVKNFGGNAINMRLNRSLLASFLAVPLSFIAAQAAPVTGIANIAGNVTVTSNAINFAPTFTPAGGAETGDFAGLVGGTIKSLTGGPLTGNVNIPSFAVFNTGTPASPITFDLTFIAPGSGTSAACATGVGACTPTGSPFTLLQLSPTTVLIGLDLNGYSYTGSSATGSSPTVSVFSTQTAVDGTVPDIIAKLSSGGSISGVTYSAQFVASPVPEPASMLLMGLGLAGAGVIARRKTVKK